MGYIIKYLAWVFYTLSWWRAKSRCSRRLTARRKVRRAVLRTTRMFRSSAGHCVCRLPLVSPGGSVEPSILELVCVHRVVHSGDGSAAALRLLVPHWCFPVVFFLSHCSVLCGAGHNRVLAVLSVAVVADTLSAYFAFHTYHHVDLLDLAFWGLSLGASSSNWRYQFPYSSLPGTLRSATTGARCPLRRGFLQAVAYFLLSPLLGRLCRSLLVPRRLCRLRFVVDYLVRVPAGGLDVRIAFLDFYVNYASSSSRPGQAGGFQPASSSIGSFAAWALRCLLL